MTSSGIDFTVGLDFLTPHDRARFQRKAERAYKKAGHLNAKALKMEKEIGEWLKPKKTVIPQCGLRLIPLAQAQATPEIKYHGVLFY